eukprot:Protomagalhaensia_sp_Gyna_25__366@NODE_1172_length_2101_cov_141_185257_g931_i0_p2_GENE_NODE_1172_length_2101_cov_141_185257_g931_i0NODE_1172_length_2101_cov_141_185257_g931_i0_p2_ORF_typecomplete_len124_score21_61DUF3729/PF12526_8/1_3e03DUF3729/PF12526_8/0_5DUF3729/PF12526_8/98_NODE_1172_length_2101_cov_141_185257_g931_i0426797
MSTGGFPASSRADVAPAEGALEPGVGVVGALAPGAGAGAGADGLLTPDPFPLLASTACWLASSARRDASDIKLLAPAPGRGDPNPGSTLSAAAFTSDLAWDPGRGDPIPGSVLSAAGLTSDFA